jgi:hypothetical protein
MTSAMCFLKVFDFQLLQVAGNTIYNMIKLEETELIDERPVKPQKIISTEVADILSKIFDIMNIYNF